MSSEIDSGIQQLADARHELAEAREAEAAIKEQYKEVFERARLARAAEKEQDAALRELVLTVYAETGEVELHDSIKIVKVLGVEINDEEAVKVWAVFNRRFELVNLNVKAFKAIAATGGAPSGLINEGTITVVKDAPALRIARDLTQYETQPELDENETDGRDWPGLMNEEPSPQPIPPAAGKLAPTAAEVFDAAIATGKLLNPKEKAGDTETPPSIFSQTFNDDSDDSDDIPF